MTAVEWDEGAEKAVLGVMMLSRDAIAEVEAILGDGSGFYRPAHTTIYRALLALRDREAPTDPVAVTNHLMGSGELSRVGGIPYLSECYQAAATAPQAAYYARIVRGHARRRALATIGAQIRRLAMDTGPGESDEAVERARQLLASIDSGPPDLTLRDWTSMVPQLLEEIERAAEGDSGPQGVPTGLYDLDDLLGGLREGQLIVVGGRPGTGKSILLTQIAAHAALTCRQPTAMFSLEMSCQEIALRIAAAGASVPLKTLMRGDLDDRQWSRLARYVGQTEGAPLWIDDTPRVTLAHIRTALTQLTRRHGDLALVVVDYLQLAEYRATGRESRQEQVAALARGLKLLAKEFRLPVVAASQLNRGPEGRSDKRPQLSDLRESGALEQDADVVILLHREDLQDEDSPRAGEIDLIVAKHRQGPTDTISAAAQFHLARLASLADVDI